MTIDGLVKALRCAGFDIHPDHLLDALWLGSLGRDLTTIEIPTIEPNVPPTPIRDEGDPAAHDGHVGDGRKDAHDAANTREDDPTSRPLDGGYAPIYGFGDVAAEDVTIPAAGIILPSARALPVRLPLIRAMRPFRRQFPSHAFELDEARTAELTAEMQGGVEGSVFPVMRPRYERWYEAHVVVEDDPTIELWSAVLREFSQLLRDTGAFRLIRSWRLRFDCSAPSDLSKARLESPAGGLSSPRSLGVARQLIFFASHGLSRCWIDGTYARLLGSWSASSVTLLHLLPRSRWSQTILGEPQALAHSLQLGSPNATLDVETFWWRSGPDPDNREVVRLPAIAIEPASLALWARTLMGLGRQTEAFLLDPAATWTDDSVENTPISKQREKDVERALATLLERSAPAYDLAIMLASAPFTLPVARLVQEVTQDGGTDFSVLAELMLSGIVVPRVAGVTVARETTYYVIREHARTILLRSLRGVDANALARLLDARISKHLSDIAGRTIQFSALIEHPEGHAKLPIWAQEFAHITRALQSSSGATPRERNWRDAVDGLDDTVIGRMARLASVHITFTSEVIDERLWRHVNDPRFVRLTEDKKLGFVPAVADYLRERLASSLWLGLTILWVDDNPINNTHIATRLIDAGATVIEAMDTREALAEPRLQTCDLVISDMSRKGNDRAGYDLMRSLLARSHSLPIVFFAGYTMSNASRRKAVVEAGAFGGTNREAELLFLIERAAVASVLRKGSSERREIESAVVEKLRYEKRNIENIPDGEFCTLDEIYQLLSSTDNLSAADRIVGSLMFFETQRQRSWLIVTTRLLLLLLDDSETRRNRRLCQRAFPIWDGGEVTTSIDAKGVATFRIGGRKQRPWYYSRALFESPSDLKAAIRQLVRKADSYLAARQSSSSTSDTSAQPRFAQEKNLASAALLRIDIDCDDDIVLDIVIEAARFRPDPGVEHSISLSRIFCGALMAARGLRDLDSNRAPFLLAFEATLASAGWREVSRNIIAQFQRQEIWDAHRRLDIGFSQSARNVLLRAARRGADSDGISASSLVLALLTPEPSYEKSLLYRSLLNLPALRADVEKRARDQRSMGANQLLGVRWGNITANYPIGTKLNGRVTNITDYGAFVELEPGIEGLIHVSEMSWIKKNVHPGKIVSTSQEVEVMVLEVDPFKRRISLGLKQTLANPWEVFTEKYPPGTVVEGEVKNKTEFGLFISLDGDVNGMVNLSDLDWNRPGEQVIKEFSLGDKIKAVVLDVDVEKERISLGVKQLAVDPFEKAGHVKRGQVVTCLITEVKEGGLEVMIVDQDLTTFIKRAELARERGDRRPERFAAGDYLNARVIQFDRKTRKIQVSIKALEMAEEKKAIAQFGSSDSRASLGDILSAAPRASEGEGIKKKDVE